MQLKTTILFEDPFWVGYVEREDGTEYGIARVVFGTEPGAGEIHAFFLERSLKFIPAEYGSEKTLTVNPKRRIREARQAVIPAGGATKARQALKAEFEKEAGLCKKARRERKKGKQEEQYRLSLLKRKEKRRGK